LAINSVFDDDRKKIATLGRARFSCEHVLEYVMTLPRVSVPLLSQALTMTAPTARSALNHLVTLGVLDEISGKERDKVYAYTRYLRILEEGTEPF
jgi:ribosomal protein S25